MTASSCIGGPTRRDFLKLDGAAGLGRHFASPNGSDTARLSVVDNGNQMGHDSFTESTHPLFYGKAVAVLRSIPGKSGEAVLKVKTDCGIEESVTLCRSNN